MRGLAPIGNIQQMYNVIYDNMVAARIAIKLDHQVYMHKDGVVVDNPNKDKINFIDDNQPNLPLGLPCSEVNVHPDYLLFFD